MQRKKAVYDEDMHSGQSSRRVRAWLQYHLIKLRTVLIWFTWTMLLAITSMVEVGWSFDEALYFAVSSLSTGGHW